MFLNKLAGAAVVALGLVAATSAQAAIGNYTEDVDGVGLVEITAPNNLKYVVFAREDGLNPTVWNSAISEGQWVNFSLISGDLGTTYTPDSIQVSFACPSGTCFTKVFSTDTYGIGGSDPDAALNAWLNAPASYPQSIWLTAYAPAGATGVTVTVLNGLDLDEDGKTVSYNIAMGAAQVVPEPETYALLMGGLGVVGFLARRRKQQG